MTLGCPVVTSRTSSLPEVTGDAAILVDPRDSLEIAEAIAKVVADTGLRKDLIARGHERATLFSWEKTARETLAAYRSLL
jgi:glycosyltransferase involved in cell wall biosynthesis